MAKPKSSETISVVSVQELHETARSSVNLIDEKSIGRSSLNEHHMKDLSLCIGKEKSGNFGNTISVATQIGLYNSNTGTRSLYYATEAELKQTVSSWFTIDTNNTPLIIQFNCNVSDILQAGGTPSVSSDLYMIWFVFEITRTVNGVSETVLLEETLCGTSLEDGSLYYDSTATPHIYPGGRVGKNVSMAGMHMAEKTTLSRSVVYTQIKVLSAVQIGGTATSTDKVLISNHHLNVLALALGS